MIADAVAAILADAGITDVFVDHLPATPSSCVAIFEMAGEQPPTAQNWRYPHVQVIVRGTSDPRIGRATAEAAFNALHGYTGSLGSVECVTFRCLASGPEHIGPDANGRHEYSLNFEVHTAH